MRLPLDQTNLPSVLSIERKADVPVPFDVQGEPVLFDKTVTCVNSCVTVVMGLQMCAYIMLYWVVFSP